MSGPHLLKFKYYPGQQSFDELAVPKGLAIAKRFILDTAVSTTRRRASSRGDGGGEHSSIATSSKWNPQHAVSGAMQTLNS
jgi:hypothetical protein